MIRIQTGESYTYIYWESSCRSLHPLETPETIDRAGTERMVRRVIEGGVNALFLLGSTGEGAGAYCPARGVSSSTLRLPLRRCAAGAGRNFRRVGGRGGGSGESRRAGRWFPPSWRHPPVTFRQRRRSWSAITNGWPVRSVCRSTSTTIAGTDQCEHLSRAGGKIGRQGEYCRIQRQSGDLAAFRSAVKLLGGRPDFSLLIGPEHLTLPALQMGGGRRRQRRSQSLSGTFCRALPAVREGAPQERLSAIQREIVRLGELYGSLPGAPGVIRGLKYELARLA